jgi:uncharacterized protein YdaU (DUF1376 family)
MADFPYLPLWTDAYLADTRHLSTLEHGAYLLLLMSAWRMGDCCLPDDDTCLARIAGLDRGKWRAIKPRIMAMWTLGEDGCWYQKRLNKERNHLLANSRKASAAAKTRWKNNSLKTKEVDHANAEAEHVPADCPIVAPIPTSKPITIIVEEGREGYAHARAKTDLETPPDLADMQGLAEECARAAGTRQADPAQFGRDIALCRDWTRAGASPQLILGTIRDGVAAASSPIFSLRYFDQPIHTAIARQEAIANGHAARKNGDVDEVTRSALARIEARAASRQG